MSDGKFSAFTLSYADVHGSQPISLQDSQMLYYKIVYYTLSNNNIHLHTVLKNMSLNLVIYILLVIVVCVQCGCCIIVLLCVEGLPYLKFYMYQS